MLGHASAAMTSDTYADLFDPNLDADAVALNESNLCAEPGRIRENQISRPHDPASHWRIPHVTNPRRLAPELVDCLVFTEDRVDQSYLFYGVDHSHLRLCEMGK
jgi:hypothetical protein